MVQKPGKQVVKMSKVHSLRTQVDFNKHMVQARPARADEEDTQGTNTHLHELILKCFLRHLWVIYGGSFGCLESIGFVPMIRKSICEVTGDAIKGLDLGLLIL